MVDDVRVITIQRRLKLTPRTCAVCGREISGWGRQRFCGKPCQRKWDYQQHAEARRANRREYYRRQKEGHDGGGQEDS
jgi:tRNA(Ile2) C34 agmatinyltransferase TiaS